MSRSERSVTGSPAAGPAGHRPVGVPWTAPRSARRIHRGRAGRCGGVGSVGRTVGAAVALGVATGARGAASGRVWGGRSASGPAWARVSWRRRRDRRGVRRGRRGRRRRGGWRRLRTLDRDRERDHRKRTATAVLVVERGRGPRERAGRAAGDRDPEDALLLERPADQATLLRLEQRLLGRSRRGVRRLPGVVGRDVQDRDAVDLERPGMVTVTPDLLAASARADVRDRDDDIGLVVDAERRRCRIKGPRAKRRQDRRRRKDRGARRERRRDGSASHHATRVAGTHNDGPGSMPGSGASVRCSRPSMNARTSCSSSWVVEASSSRSSAS